MSKYTDSPLVNYTCISPNCNSPRNHAIDTITIHMVWGQCSVETLGEIFKPVSRQASSNYGIGPDGRVGMYCHERDRSWCSSSPANDNRAITIETASDRTWPYAVTDKAYATLIKLCADICIRNGKTKMVWCGSLEATNNRKFKSNEMRMTLHKWFADTECPGWYLESRMGEIAIRTNALIAWNMSPFKDVKTTDPKYSHIRNCYNEGIVKGYSDGTFKPKDNLTRGDACILINRVMEKKGIKPVSRKILPFSDVTEDNPKYRHIKACYDAGLINGYPDGTFRPEDNITREDVCVIISKLLQKK